MSEQSPWCWQKFGKFEMWYLELVGCEQLAALLVESGVGIDLEVEFEQSTEAFQDAARQVSIVALLEQLLDAAQGKSEHESRKF